jgi:transcriptional regulator with XRE-family HTH domain
MPRSTRPPSPEAEFLAKQIRQMREAGFSVREIARRTGISKSHVHNIDIGKRGVSAARAVRAAERSSRERWALTLIDGQMRAVDPLTQRDHQKISRYMRAVKDAKRFGDFRDIRRRFRRTVIKTSEGEFRLETDPRILMELDDAGILNIDEVFHYEPVARAA